MAIEIIRPADRTAWLAARQQDVTASVAGCLLGIHPYTTAFQLWAEKTGRVIKDDRDNKTLRRGRILEPAAIEMLREDRPEWTVEYKRDNAYWRDTDARLGATPDAFATRPDIFGQGVVQVKTVGEQVFREQWVDEDGEIILPLWIAVQAIVEAELTGGVWACVALMIIGRGIDLEVIDVPLHAGVKRRLRAAVREFWRMAGSAEHPPIDWMRDGDAVLEVYGQSMPERLDRTSDLVLDDMLHQYRAARSAETAQKKAADYLKPKIIYALGDAEAARTVNWNVSARTTVRTGDLGQPIRSRTLRITPRENINASF